MADWQIDRDWRRLAMVPEAISSRQCSANTPIQGQSNANRDPVLDWRFFVNPRKSRSILCNANTNSVPIGAQTDSSSVANPMPIGANPLPIHRQSCANPLPIRCQSDVSQLSRSFANLVPIHRQSIANQWPIRCQPPQPIHRQSSANLVPILQPIECQSFANLVPIECQSSANPMQIHCQSSTNRMPIWCQSSANPM